MIDWHNQFGCYRSCWPDPLNDYDYDYDYLNSLRADHIIMENADCSAEGLYAFRDLRPELVVIGINNNRVESTDDVARAMLVSLVAGRNLYEGRQQLCGV